MILTSMPVHLLAANVDHNNLSDNKSEIINNNKTPVKVAKLEAGNTAADLIKNPDKPAIYTLRTDYKVQRGEKYKVNYQPYIASVGAAASDDQKAKVNKTIKLPVISGYIEPQDDFKIDYNTIKDAADGKNQTGDKTNGIRYQANEDFRYDAKSNQIKIKHVFQDLEDFTRYTNPDGSVGDENALITTQYGNTGSTMEVSPLTEGHPNRKGFVPERKSIIMQVPENAENFILEYRYNRAHYDVVFDTQGGTALSARTLYYGQVIPKIAGKSIPTKLGCEFQGWKPSVELKTKDGKTFKENEIIAVGTDAIKNLDANLIMPASKVTFTAVWKDKVKADYAVQFWAEKADHADGASLLDKYDYIGTRVYKDQNTGSRPNLDNVSVKDIVFPDLDQARLKNIWDGEKSNSGKNTYLNKFYVYNKDLTHEQNKDTKDVRLVKSVDATGKTVYNIYYDRQVYDLYFTKSNVVKEKRTFYPEIYKYDEMQGKPVKKGGPGNPYHFKARFNQKMVGLWPDDVKEVRGFDEGNNSLGWLPNLKTPEYYYRDTPPYRLSANLFIDFPELEKQGGYVSKIDLGNGQTKPASITDLSFGIEQLGTEGINHTIPHHIDFWLDGFDDNQVIDYDLYTIKSDTDNSDYKHRPPDLQGFTPKEKEGIKRELKDEYDLDNLNEDREEITPFPKVYSKELDEDGEPKQKGKMYLMSNFPNDDSREFYQNGYLKFEYTRNKYPLRFNYDPSKIKGDNEFNSTNQLDTFYEFPLKALSPIVVPKLSEEQKDKGEKEEYFKDNPANLLDNPVNLQKLGLTDLVFTDTDGKLKVKRPDNISNQMVFKGWALDPAGTKLIWENPGEKMPNHPVNLYAKWGELDYKWKVTFDPNGGNLRNIKEKDLTTSSKKIQEGDIGQEKINTYAKKEDNNGDKQVFTVIQRQKLVEPKIEPTRKGYDFMGWEVIRYKKDAKGDYTDEIDNSYRETYKVPELYSFGNDVVAPVYLKAIWVPNDRVDVKIIHHILDKDYKEVKKVEETIADKRKGYLVATTGDKQSDNLILVPHKEIEEKLTGDLKKLYDEYNERVKANNTYFHQFRVEPEKKLNPATNKVEDNPDVKNNIFHFFYKPFRTRQYKVNYIDERAKEDIEAEKDTSKKAELIKKNTIIKQELVSNGNRHYDARNYRSIPGWVLAEGEKPQQQLFFDVNEETNELLGINGTGKDEITFYYKDVRVIEVPKDGETPEGYVRVTFKADKGGSFGKDKDGKDIKELNYDVMKGLKSDLLPVPKELGTKTDGTPNDKVEGKYYITPETGRKFTKWDNSPLLNKNTIINEAHTFTAYFEWSGLSATGLVRTEAFKDPSGTWNNDFAPTIAKLKEQLVWREKGKAEKLPAGAVINLYDEAGKELTTDDQLYDLVNEKNKADEEQLVRTVNVKAKVTFKGGKEPQELDIPITVYKNVYEALIKEGDKPLFLKEAEKKEAKDGGLEDVTGNYVKVTVAPTGDMKSKDNKVYYVNPKAWVEIPEVKPDGSSTFINWTADQVGQNDDGKENGNFDFGKRHKFTGNTVISPSDAKDVVEQEKGKDKPDVPKTYVKVIVKTTDNATDETAFERTFWVNPTKEVTIDVTNPTGKTVAADATKPGTVGYTMKFSKWETEDKAKTWDAKIVGQFTAETIILAKYKTITELKVFEQSSEVVSEIPIVSLNQSDIDKDWFKIKNKKETDSKIKNVEITEKPATDSLGIQSGKAKVTFENGLSRIITIKLKVVGDVIETKDDKKTKDVPDNYKLVILDSTSDSLEQTKRYFWINPDKDITLKAFKPQGKAGKVFDKWERSLSINWNKEGITENVLTIKAIYKDETTPDQPGDKPADKPGTNPETPGINPETPEAIPENPGAIPGTTPGVVEKHGHRYIERVAGKDRVHTSINTSRRFFNKSRYVIIADSGNYPDALTATVLAHVLDAPILLNNTRYLEDDVAREIVRLGASEVIIVGGNKSISENVKSQLARYDQNSVQRIWGRDRYVTSSELAYEIQRLTGKVNKAIIASGENFPDALATAPLGSKEIAPILLVRRNQIDKKVDKALKDLNIKRVYVAGGPHSVSKKLEEQLPQVIRRFNGRDRYETAILVAGYTYPESKEVFVASGEVFPDALVVGPVCARRKAPILLSRTTPVKVTDDYIEKSKIEYLYIIGGTNTIYAETAHKYAIED